MKRFLSSLFHQRPQGLLATEVADRAERLLDGMGQGWDVDDYEHFNPSDPEVRELWHRTMEIGGLPEEWSEIDENRKNELRSIVVALRALAARKAQ